MILLDTSVLSRVFRRQRPGPAERELHASFEALLAGDRSVGLPGIVFQEILTASSPKSSCLNCEESSWPDSPS